jgi:hypothetical protein
MIPATRPPRRAPRVVDEVINSWRMEVVRTKKQHGMHDAIKTEKVPCVQATQKDLSRLSTDIMANKTADSTWLLATL